MHAFLLLGISIFHWDLVLLNWYLTCIQLFFHLTQYCFSKIYFVQFLLAKSFNLSPWNLVTFVHTRHRCIFAYIWVGKKAFHSKCWQATGFLSSLLQNLGNLADQNHWLGNLILFIIFLSVICLLQEKCTRLQC